MFRARIASFLLLFCMFIPCLQAQNIVKRVNVHVLIDVGPSYGLKEGDRVKVFRSTGMSGSFEVGTVQVVTFRQGKCAAKVIQEKSGYRINKGDYIQQGQGSDLDFLFGESEPDLNQSRQSRTAHQAGSGRTSHTLSYVLIGTGVASLGYGYYTYGQANSYYDKYEATGNYNEAVKYYNKTIDYDKSAQIYAGIGGGLIAIGVMKIILSNRSGPASYSYDKIKVIPVCARHYLGIHFNYALN